MSSGYNEYLQQHIRGVLEAYDNIYAPILEEEGVPSSNLEHIRTICKSHDQSKYYDPEYTAYSTHYDQGRTREGKDDVLYQRAWNHHQKSNPHHWQYWVLLRDSETPHQIILDMPLEYIIEMLCDWTSSSRLHNTTAHQWYRDQKDNMLLSTKTRAIIEYFLSKVKE